MNGIQETDLFLMNRGIDSYKVSAQDLFTFVSSASGDIDGGFAPDTQETELNGGSAIG